MTPEQVADQQLIDAQRAERRAERRRLPSWREMAGDTTPEASALLFRLWHETPARRKMELLEALNHTVRELALAGLRRRFPEASPATLNRRLAELLLGADLAERVSDTVLTRRGGAVADTEMLTVPRLVTDVLEKLGVPYVIGGSFAGMIHGMLRATMDVDIVADLRPEHVAPFVSALGAVFYVDEQAIRQAIRQRGSFNLIHLATLFKVDIFIPQERAYDRRQLERRVAQAVSADEHERFWVLTAEDVVLTKLDWFRRGGEVSERQWRDVLGVIKTQGRALDIPYMKK